MPSHLKWWEVVNLDSVPIQSIAPVQRVQEEEKDEGQGLFGSFTGKILKIPAKGLAEVGGAALEGLEWYNKRFATTTASWFFDMMGDISQEATGSRALFGPDNPNRINLLKGWFDNPLGDTNEEIEKAQAHLEQMHWAQRLIFETLADPTTWLTLGSGAAGKLLVTRGALMIGKSSKEINAATQGAQVFKALFGNKLAMENLSGAVGSAGHNQAASALIQSGAMLRALAGTPEALFSVFLKGMGKGFSEIPALRLTIKQGKNGPHIVPEVGIPFGAGPKLGDISARSQAANALRGSDDLMSQAREGVLAQTNAAQGVGGGSALGSVDLEHATIKFLSNPNSDVTNFSPFAKDAFKTLHRNGVDITDLHLKFDDVYDQSREMGRLIGAAKMDELGIASKESIEALSPAGQLIAKATRMDGGYRFFENNLARTFLHGVLFSPWYVLQNGVTDPFLAGMMAWGMKPAMARTVYGNVLGNLEKTLISRTGFTTRASTKGFRAGKGGGQIDANDNMIQAVIGRDNIGGSAAGDQMAGTLTNAPSNHGGYLVDGVRAISRFAGNRFGAPGRQLGAAADEAISAPLSAAAALDEGFFRGVWEKKFTEFYRMKLAFHQDPEAAKILQHSDNFYRALRNAGVGNAQAGAASKAMLTSFSEKQFMDKMRQITNMNVDEMLNFIPTNGDTFLPADLQMTLVRAIRELLDAGDEILATGKNVTIPDPRTGKPIPLRITGVNKVKREDLPNYVITKLEETRAYIKESAFDYVNDNVQHSGVRAAMSNFVENTHTNLERVEKKLIDQIRNANKANLKSRDIEFLGDSLLRVSANRQAVNRLIADAVEQGFDNPNAVQAWAQGQDSIFRSAFSMGDGLDEFIEGAMGARKAVLSGTDDVTREAYGSFRDRYAQFGASDLPAVGGDANEIVNAIDDFSRTMLDDVSTTYFNNIYQTMGIQGKDMGMKANYFRNLNKEIDGWVDQAIELSTQVVAAKEPILEHARRFVAKKGGEGVDFTAAAAIMQDAAGAARNEAMDVALERMGDFYMGMTNLDEMLNWMFPFSRFGTRIMAIGPRALSRSPNVIPMFGRWTHESDQQMAFPPGWIPLIGNISINPFAALAPYQQFEALTDPRVFGSTDIERITQSFGLAGLAPGPGLMAILGQLGQTQFEGTLFPGQRALRLLELLPLPYSDLPNSTLNNIANLIYRSEGDDPALDREIQRVLADMEIDPATVPKGSDQWNLARNEAILQGGYQFLIGGATGSRYIDNDRIAFAQKEAEALVAQGIPTEEQITLKRTSGTSPWSKLNAEQKDAVIAQIGEEEFRRRVNVTPPRLSEKGRNQWNAIMSFYALSDISQNHMDNEIALAGQALLQGQNSGEEYRDRKRNAALTYNASLDGQRRAILATEFGADVMNPAEFSEDVIYEMFQDMRDDLKRQSRGSDRQRTIFEEDEARDQYNSISPNQYLNPITGEIAWDLWEADREAFLRLQPQGIQDYILRVNENRAARDPVEEIYEVAKQEIDEYGQIQRYLGLRQEDQELAFETISAISALQGIGYTTQRALIEIAKTNSRAAFVARQAMRRPNPARRAFWESHPLLQIFFTDDIVPNIGTILQ